MDTAILVGVIAVIVIAVVSRLGQRSRVAAPLLLVLVGIVLSFLPFMPDVVVEPEIILAVVLPPLLFSSAVNMPAMNFRREFSAIAALAVLLVLASSILMGLFFHMLFPEIALSWCIALGAILSPTDAVATSIARNAGISSRVSAILDGESLLNDATALVTLRTAVAAAAASFSLWHAIGQFVYSVAIALVIGLIVGHLGVWARAKAKVPAVSTALSLTVPFVASVPTDLLGASGLVAAVVAGIVTGRRRLRAFHAEQRISDRTMWLTVTLVLEGSVFLIMGLELRHLIRDQRESIDATSGLGMLVVYGIVALIAMLAIRALFLLPLTRYLGLKASRMQANRPRLEAMREALDAEDDRERENDREREDRRDAGAGGDAGDRTSDPSRTHTGDHPRGEGSGQNRLSDRARRRAARTLSDIDYLVRQPLTPRDAAIMVAAGMRGAVTLAAAQTLPADTPHRASLILIAFTVAVLSLLIQGGLLGRLVVWLKPSRPDPEEIERQRESLADAVNSVTVDEREGESFVSHLLRTIAARREKVLDIADAGIYDAECTNEVLGGLDAQELGLLLRHEDEVRKVRGEE